MATYQDGIRVSISADGRKKCEDEQRLTRLDRLYVEVKLGSVLGAVMTIASLVILKILGA